MSQPEDTPREHCVINMPVEPVTCEVCGIIAYSYTADLVEGVPRRQADGTIFKTYEILAQHAYCPDHHRPPVIVPYIGGWAVVAAEGWGDITGGGMQGGGVAEEPAPQPEGKPWSIGGVVKMGNEEYEVMQYTDDDQVLLRNTDPDKRDRPPMRYAIRIVQELIDKQANTDEHTKES